MTLALLLAIASIFCLGLDRIWQREAHLRPLPLAGMFCLLCAFAVALPWQMGW